MENEIWKDVVGWEGFYEVSNLGKIRGLDRSVMRKNGIPCSRKGKVKEPYIGDRGYYKVSLCRNHRSYAIKIHRLVAEAFIPNPDLFKEVNHRNGNKLDNRVENIEWCSRSHNLKHSYRVLNRVPPMLGRLAEKNPRSIPVLQFTKEGDFIKEHTNLRNAGRSVNTSGDNISRACKLKHKFSYSKGFIWKFKKDYINEQENHVLHSNVSE